jgi:hypothetical protein
VLTILPKLPELAHYTVLWTSTTFLEEEEEKEREREKTVCHILNNIYFLCDTET